MEATKCIFRLGGLLSFHPLPKKVMKFMGMALSPLAPGSLDLIIVNIYRGTHYWAHKETSVAMMAEQSESV